MIDLTTLKIIIENLQNSGFTTSEEKLLAIVLAFIDTEDVPLQQCEIVKILELHEKHCRNILDLFGNVKLGNLRGQGLEPQEHSATKWARNRSKTQTDLCNLLCNRLFRPTRKPSFCGRNDFVYRIFTQKNKSAVEKGSPPVRQNML